MIHAKIRASQLCLFSCVKCISSLSLIIPRSILHCNDEGWKNTAAFADGVSLWDRITTGKYLVL